MTVRDDSLLSRQLDRWKRFGLQFQTAPRTVFRNEGDLGSTDSEQRVMHTPNRRQFLGSSLAAAGAGLFWPSASFGDVLPRVERVAAPMVTGQEQNVQKDIWAAEVRYKPVRMVVAQVTDPATYQSQRKLVWYLAYRVVIRPSSALSDATVKTPDRPVFVPEVTLTVDDEGREQSYPDQVLPEVLPAILRREKHDYKTSVDVVGPLPAISPEDSRRIVSLDGVATWTGINPDTNYFSVVLSGFSNGYRIVKDDEGGERVERRMLRQRFWRPSDRFDQNEKEIRFKGEPEWFYQ